MKKSTRSKVFRFGAVVVGLIFLVLGVLMAFGWIPFPDFLLDQVVAGAAFFVLLAAVVLWKFRGKTQRSIQDIQEYWEQDKQSQLTDKEAYELLRYELSENRFLGIREIHERGSDIVGPEGQDDNARLYKMVYDRKNVKEKVGVVLDLEQDLDVDPYDTTSLRKAAPKIQNIRVIRGKKVDDFDQAMEDAVSSLGRSLDQKITTTKYDEEGTIDEKKSVPASLMRAKARISNKNGVDEEVEE